MPVVALRRERLERLESTSVSLVAAFGGGGGAGAGCGCCPETPTRAPRKSTATGRRKTSEPRLPTDVVHLARPTNCEAERLKFFSCDEETYQPQFIYLLPPPLLERALRRHRAEVQVERRYVPHAMRVLCTLLQRYGSYDRYEEQMGGEVVPEAEARPIVAAYLQELGVEDEIRVNFDPTLVARASFVKGAQKLNIRPQGLRRNWIQGMLHHEVGTHFLRDRNDKVQPWAREKNGRKRYRLEDKNPTEEGLATLHTVLEREGHYLWRAALLYYATWRALQLSFRDLYEDLGQFLGNSLDERWDYCVRAKRGLLDTSQPGGFAKDQAYLAGAMDILEQRKRIDWTALYAGKISVLDSHRARSTGLSKLDKVRLPVFLQGAEKRARYMELLDEIVRDNGLTDLVVDRGERSKESAGGSGNSQPAWGAPPPPAPHRPDRASDRLSSLGSTQRRPSTVEGVLPPVAR